MPSIIVEMDRVIIEGVEIKRPVRICRSAWLQYWGPNRP